MKISIILAIILSSGCVKLVTVDAEQVEVHAVSCEDGLELTMNKKKNGSQQTAPPE